MLIDCGLFQGSREVEQDNAAPFDFDAASIDFVLLTHAHLDHCGRLPLLVKRGFRGEIITTSATRELSRIVLLDAAHLAEEDALRRLRRHLRQGENGVQPLYTLVDALATLDRFGRTAHYDYTILVAPGISDTFYDGGSWPGSLKTAIDAA